jgi:hypothetical protein
MQPFVHTAAMSGLIKGIMLMLTLLNCRDDIQAQPQYSTNFFTSVTQSAIPFNSSANNKVQWVYYPSDFATAPSGNITKIYFRAAPSMLPVICDFTNFQVKMGHTSLSMLPPGPWVTANMTTVFSANSFQVWPLPGDWMAVTLQTPFAYNGTQNFIVEASQGAYSVGFYVMQANLTGRSLYGSTVSLMGNPQDLLCDFGFDIGLGTTDASLEDFSGLGDTLCSGIQPVIVMLKNNGPSAMTSATINWRINNIVQPSFAWTGNLAVNGIANVTIAQYNFLPSASYAITAWTSNPNNQPDINQMNDTITGSTLHIAHSPTALPTSTSYMICAGDTVLIGGTLTGIPPWSVTLSDGATSYLLSNLITPSYGKFFSPLTSKTYSVVSVTDGSGCSSSGGASSLVIVNPVPTLSPGPDQTIRMSGSVTLDAGAGHTSYLWSTGATTQTIQVIGTSLSPGTYPFAVTVTNQYNCTASDTVWVTIIDDTGIEMAGPHGFVIYPIPSSGKISLSPYPHIGSGISIEVISTDMKRVFFYDDPIHPGTEPLDVDLSHLQGGVYLVKLVLGNESLIRKIILLKQ